MSLPNVSFEEPAPVPLINIADFGFICKESVLTAWLEAKRLNTGLYLNNDVVFLRNNESLFDHVNEILDKQKALPKDKQVTVIITNNLFINMSQMFHNFDEYMSQEGSKLEHFYEAFEQYRACYRQ